MTALETLKRYTHGKKNTDKVEISVLALNRIINSLSQEPTSEMVHVETLRQVMWERDIAIEQLHELGYEFGQKIELCDGAVSREAVKKWVCKTCPNDAECQRKCDVIKGIDALPSVLQKSETGHWINLEKKYKGQVLPFWGRYGCSKCGGYGEGTFNYCPNCGAKMVEPQESEDKE